MKFQKWVERVNKRYAKRRLKNAYCLDIVTGKYKIITCNMETNPIGMKAACPPAFGPGCEQLILQYGYASILCDWKGRERMYYGSEAWDDASIIDRMKAKFLGG